MKITYRNIYGDMIIKLPKEDIKKEYITVVNDLCISLVEDTIIFYPMLKQFSASDKEIEDKYNNDTKLINNLCKKWEKHISKNH